MTKQVDAEMAALVKECLGPGRTCDVQSALHRKALEYILQLEQERTPLVEEVVQARLRSGKHCNHSAEQYYLAQNTHIVCRHCGQLMWALCTDAIKGRLPQFRICFGCKFVEQHGGDEIKVRHDSPND
jgi:hypothetical protein